MDEGPLNIAAAEQGGGRHLTLVGEATIYAAAPAKARLLAELNEAAALSLDLSGVHEVDTSFVQLLLLLAREAGRGNKPLKIGAVSRPVEQILELYFLTERLLGRAEAA